MPRYYKFAHLNAFAKFAHLNAYAKCHEVTLMVIKLLILV